MKLTNGLFALGLVLALASRASAQSPAIATFLFGPVSSPGPQSVVSAPTDSAGRLPGSLIVQVFVSGSVNITLSGSIDNLPPTPLPILNVAGQSISAITASGDFWIPAVQSIQATVNSINGTARASMIASAGVFAAIAANPSTLTVAKNSSVTIITNANGSGGAPVAVTTAAPVKVLTGSTVRKSYTFFSETSDLRCVPGTTADVANAISPTASVGFLIRALTYAKEDIAPGNRLDCIALSATSNVDTWEEN